MLASATIGETRDLLSLLGKSERFSCRRRAPAGLLRARFALPAQVVCGVYTVLPSRLEDRVRAKRSDFPLWRSASLAVPPSRNTPGNPQYVRRTVLLGRHLRSRAAALMRLSFCASEPTRVILALLHYATTLCRGDGRFVPDLVLDVPPRINRSPSPCAFFLRRTAPVSITPFWLASCSSCWSSVAVQDLDRASRLRI